MAVIQGIGCGIWATKIVEALGLPPTTLSKARRLTLDMPCDGKATLTIESIATEDGMEKLVSVMHTLRVADDGIRTVVNK